MSAHGPEGNERLTTTVGAVLLALLFVEGVTVLFIHQMLSVHVFLGMLLIPPVLLKIGSTVYRFARYYTHNPAYREKGPPPLILRAIGPGLVASSLALLASGVWL